MTKHDEFVKEAVSNVTMGHPDWYGYFDDLIHRVELATAAAVEAEKTVIKAKALRKKGTNKFYGFHAGDEKWMIMKWFPVYLGRTLKKHFARLEEDAELIDIEISYQPKQEEDNNGN